MPNGSSRARIVMGGIAGLPSLILVLGAILPDEASRGTLVVATQRQGASDRPRDADAIANRFEYLGAAACRDCHSEPRQNDTDYVQLTEFTVWKNTDKHSQAYEVLNWEKARRMGRILKIDDVTKSDRCLNCHAINPPQTQRLSDFKLADGVSCEGCHGPAERWGLIHRSKDWREKTAAEKASYGMVDLRNPALRAQLCATCHVGNAPQGKVATHELYAAGHPPIPGFEVASFSDFMPRHWRHRRDVPYLKTAPEAIQARFDLANARFEQTKLVVLGAVICLRDAMILLASQAAPAKDEQPDRDARVAGHHSDGWPEYAFFDCGACHHDLRVPSWRQRRSGLGPPGRPMIRTWPFALARLAIRQVSKDEPTFQTKLGEFQTLARRLARASESRPFGDPAEIEAAAAAFVRWSDPLDALLADASFDEPSALGLLKELCDAAKAETPDFESARQLGWAFTIIYSEWNPQHANDAKIRAVLKTLQDQLDLQLNANRDERAKLLQIGSTEERNRRCEALASTALADELRRASDYDPSTFQAAFQELSRLLPHP
jgi:hypothetical protein